MGIKSITLHSSYLRTADSYVGRELGKLLQLKHIPRRPAAHVVFGFAGANHILVGVNVSHFPNAICEAVSAC